MFTDLEQGQPRATRQCDLLVHGAGPAGITLALEAARVQPGLDIVLAEPGRYPVTLHDDMANRWQPVGEFRVDPEPEAYRHPDGRVSEASCPIRGWGPRRVRAGKPKNTGPDGSMGMWIKTDCAPDNTRLRIGERTFDTCVGYRRVTAKIPPDVVAKPGELPVTLLAPDTGESIPARTLRVD